MSAVRLGPVTRTNSPRRPGSAAAAAQVGPGGRQVLGQLGRPGDHHARRRQVAHQPLLGRAAGDHARAGVGQQDLGRHQPGRKLRDPLRGPLGIDPAYAVRRQCGSEFPRRGTLHGADALARGRSPSSGPGAAAPRPSSGSGSARRRPPEVPRRNARPRGPGRKFCRGQTSGTGGGAAPAPDCGSRRPAADALQATWPPRRAAWGLRAFRVLRWQSSMLASHWHPFPPPPGAEGGAGDLGQGAAAGPGPQLARMPGQERRQADPLPDRPHGQPVASRAAHRPGPQPPQQPLAGRAHGRGLVDGPMAEVDELMGDVDFHRADFAARPAERRGEGERAGLLQAHQVRREDGADGAGIDPAVGPAADAAIDRAGVQAGPAADAAEGVPGRRVGQHVAPAVVEEDDVELLSRRRAVDEVGVGGQFLAGAAAGQEVQEAAAGSRSAAAPFRSPPRRRGSAAWRSRARRSPRSRSARACRCRRRRNCRRRRPCRPEDTRRGGVGGRWPSGPGVLR